MVTDAPRTAFIAALLLSGAAGAQDSTRLVASAAGPPDAAKNETVATFFGASELIEATFTTNIGRIRGDKGTNHPWRPATITYTGDDGNVVTVPLKARTRGIWRLRTCDFPPLRLDFSGKTSKGTIFQALDKPKLVSFCHDMDQYDQYILQEFQLYRIYQLLTPLSHRARLLKLVYTDSADGKVRARRYGFLLEEPAALAARMGGKMIDQHGARAGDLDPFQDALFGVFEYFIGNTDFSEAGLHNVELFLTNDGDVKPVAYDFDFSGAVNARYATVDSTLPIPNVRERLFRGYCTDAESYAKVFALFQEKKAEIYALYGDSIGKLMDRGQVKATLRYFDDFYETINDRRSAKRSITGACLGRP
jgi:hypothetical protein